MKKILLFAALICCVMPVMAQKNNDKTPDQLRKETKQKVELINRMTLSYTQKLDSVVFSEGEKYVLEYDQQLNCTKVSEYEINDEGTGWELDYVMDYEYDEQNRITSVIYNFETYGYAYKETMEYNDNGKLSVQYTWYSLGNDQWIAADKTTYTYDAQGFLTVASTYDIEDDLVSWTESQREEYTNNANGLPTRCVEYDLDYMTMSLVMSSKTEWEYDAQMHPIKVEYYTVGSENNDWHIFYRYEYTYDNNGNLIQEIYSCVPPTGGNTFQTGSMEYITRTDYRYDNHNNVIEVNEYDYEDEDWVYGSQSTLEYDLTVPASKVAGLNMIFEGEVLGLFKDKLLQIKSTMDDEVETMTFYYSAGNQVNEITGSACVVLPNPTTEVLTLKGEVEHAEIMTVDGKLVLTVENGFESINVSSLANGYYMVRATMSDGSVSTQKFVKQ